MNTTWKNFLNDKVKANWSDDHLNYFGESPVYVDPYQTHCLTDLSSIGLIEVTGAEANTFLQGQLTCDVNLLNEPIHSLGAHCNVKGRIVASFRILRRLDRFYLLMPARIIPMMLQTLSKYSVFFKVALTAVSDSYVSIGITGPKVADLLLSYWSDLPESPERYSESGHGLALRMPGDLPRYHLLGPMESMRSIWQSLKRQLTLVGHDHWTLTNILLRQASIYPETSGLFTPHALQYHEHRGISFNKGCYTGQEIIARVHYRGDTKQRCYLGVVQEEATILPGTACLVDEQKAVGTVVESSPMDVGKQACLLVVPRDYANSNHIVLDLPTRPVVQLQIH